MIYDIHYREINNSFYISQNYSSYQQTNESPNKKQNGRLFKWSSLMFMYHENGTSNWVKINYLLNFELKCIGDKKMPVCSALRCYQAANQGLQFILMVLITRVCLFVLKQYQWVASNYMHVILCCFNFLNTFLESYTFHANFSLECFTFLSPKTEWLPYFCSPESQYVASSCTDYTQ